MDYHSSIKTGYVHNITAVCFDASRKEVVTGTEDGIITFWDVKASQKLKEDNVQNSWITMIYFWEKIRTVISSSQNGLVVFWQGLMPLEVINTYQPIYAILMVDKTKQLLCGTDSKLIVYNVFENMTARTFIDRNARISMKGHRDIVRCLALGDHRAFSAGFDRRIVVYDINGAIDNKLVVLTVVRDAHGGIISCLSTARNADGQLLLISGSFDRLVKVWNEDGQLLNVIRGFNDTILSIAFIPTTETFWVASAENPIKIYDIQTANDVTDYCETFADWNSQLHHVVRLHYCPEVSMVIGITHRGYLVTWRSNPNSSLATLRTGSGIQAVAISPAQPQHFMTMGSDNRLLKWERRKSTRFSYVSEEIPINESLQECLRRTVQQKLRSFANIKADTWETLFPPSLLIRTGKRNDRSVGTPATNTRSKSPSSCSPSPSRSRSSSRYKRSEPKLQLIINPVSAPYGISKTFVDS
ncbi:TAF5 RNA polymerase II p300/CBP-associated factor-associated factor 65 kDa subunit 5L [Fasciola hepatica]|uniref:TAF5 RNA polymerase II p300/CBP-associated factor-associated factor 65 kDa subunit 5L n=1 Tax=Fasciola hepatica TaxID=6192 RepID=A0A4E0S489_FASHE|nr:TAF5 RNA polymerase II p300/CBP-associated factor-associated factor 65 kDa subunit 5L [Fasciola hepatica]